MNPDRTGTKAAAWYRRRGAGRGAGRGAAAVATEPELATTAGDGPATDDGWATVRRARCASASPRPTSSTPTWTPDGGTDEEARVMRPAFAGMLWSKQYYRYDVARWLDGDPG